MMKIGIFVNESAALKIKATMGNNPVLFLPTHRSYADFCLMTYLCYHYDIDFPVVAAGTDFLSMAMVGRRMRETGAFYIRRTLAGAPLYAATLRRYVRAVLAKHPAPFEFFLEGTRSRSNKSLPSKYGMLSMTLMPLFAREVPDVTMVPVNISYDRVMEDALYAYEHLGVPKPKESTAALLKALYNLNDHFGNIYINLGAPFSVKQYLNMDDKVQNDESLKPVDMQQITGEQFKQVQKVADYVVTLQQKYTVVTTANLTALVLMQSLMKSKPLRFDEVVSEMEWMASVLKGLGATVLVDDMAENLRRILIVHSKVMKLDKDRRLRLVSNARIDVSDQVKKKMKGHILKAETMIHAVSVIHVQLYVNPVLCYVAPAAMLYVIAYGRRVIEEQLLTEYRRLRLLLKHEFFHIEDDEQITFEKTLEYCIKNKAVVKENGCLFAERTGPLSELLRSLLWPALHTMSHCMQVMMEMVECEHRLALRRIQAAVELSGGHPYSLSLEAIAGCLRGLVAGGALIRSQGNEVIYRVMPDVMQQCCHLVTSVLPAFNISFDRSNPTILDHRVISRL